MACAQISFEITTIALGLMFPDDKYRRKLPVGREYRLSILAQMNSDHRIYSEVRGLSEIGHEPIIGEQTG